jgi:hypothetical protein
MDLDYGDQVERCSSDPYGDHSARSLNDGLRAAPEMRRCYSLSQLGLLERAVFEMEDRSVRPGLPSVHLRLTTAAYNINRFASACLVDLHQLVQWSLLHLQQPESSAVNFRSQLHLDSRT